MYPLLLIIPSRGRGHKIKECIDQLRSTAKEQVDIHVAIDEDDAYPDIEGVIYEQNPRMMSVAKINHVANKYKNKYKYIGYIGDDHFLMTEGWDVTIKEALGDIGICYGNDLLARETLATAVFLTSNIVKRFGFMGLNKLVHFFVDNWWVDVGKAAGVLTYLPLVIVEHRHFSVQKSEIDDTYKAVNNDDIFVPDRDYYNYYLQSDLYQTHISWLKKLKDEFTS